MDKLVKWLTSVWSVILITSILLFVFWGGPVFSARALNHGGRLIVSYTFIPAAVAVALIWRRRWEWAAFTYYTLGIALVKMVVTMGIYMGALPRRAADAAKPIDAVTDPAHHGSGYKVVNSGRWGHLEGRVRMDDSRPNLFAALADVPAGKALSPRRHEIDITGMTSSHRYLMATVGDTLFVTNHDGILHTFSVSGTDGPLFQLPLTPGKSAPGQILSRQGIFSSRCAQPHPDEVTTLAVWAHPYHVAVGEHGGFRLDSIPPGRYRIGVFDFGSGRDGARNEPIASENINIATEAVFTIEFDLLGRRTDDSAR
jgi:hypothetical protein